MVQKRNRFRECKLLFARDSFSVRSARVSGGPLRPRGGWVSVTVRMDEPYASELARKVEAGEVVGLSIGGYARVEPASLWRRVLRRVIAWGRRILRSMRLARVRV